MSGRFLIEGELTVFVVHALKDQLLSELATLASGQALVIDLAGVTEVDGAGIQLLLATRHEASQRGMAVQLAQTPPMVAEALNLIDLAGAFAPVSAPMETAA